MFGKNPIRGIEKGDGSILQVQDIFLTVQGEGPYTGRPALFIRLGGCNLQCSFCDTEFETFKPLETEIIIKQVQELFPNSHSHAPALVVLTGGEPFRQEIGSLCDSLIGLGYEVQIETNGLLYRPLHKDVSVVCSPKPNLTTGYSRIRPDLIPHIIAIKFLVSAHITHYQEIADVGQYEHGIDVYIQPIDEVDEKQNLLNQELALKLAHKHNARFSLQMHKVIGVE